MPKKNKTKDILSAQMTRSARLNVGRMESVCKIPDLLDVQMSSYRQFLQRNETLKQRKSVGIQAAYESVFPIESATGNAALHFISYQLGDPKFDEEECKRHGLNYAAPMHAKIALHFYDKGGAGKKAAPRTVFEEEVFMGEIPLMTEQGTFIINGTERVIVSQLHRSPGVVFEHDRGRAHGTSNLLYSARIIPYRGIWLEFEYDVKNLMYVRIDRRRRLHVTVLLRALGYTAEQILEAFFDFETFSVRGPDEFVLLRLSPRRLRGETARVTIRDAEGTVIVEQGRRITTLHVRKMEAAKIKELMVSADYLVGRVVAKDQVDQETGEIICPCNTVLTEEWINKLALSGVSAIVTLHTNEIDRGAYIADTLRADGSRDGDEARMEIYHVLRPGDQPAKGSADVNHAFQDMFLKPGRYDLSRVGRMKMNQRLGRKSRSGALTLTQDDVLEVIKTLVAVRDGRESVDDIDHLGNRRVRSVGEMAEQQLRIGLVRVERAVRDRLGVAETENLLPSTLINAKPISAAVREFFGSSQMSQFMDQVNPLSEVTHKRRVSALGPGGLTRDRAGFEVRDVHPTHYGRVCPVETPEGPNIGLINSLATYARINDYGFIETPYLRVRNGCVTDEIEHLSAIVEGDHVIAQASALLDEDGRFVEEVVSVRHNNEFTVMPPERIDYIDASRQQVVSVAAALIPCLEHNDANRALMGSNMQRQAVPGLRSEAPLVGTGMESVVARHSRVCVVAKNDGVVESVDSARIAVRVSDADITKSSSLVDIYNLTKYTRSNQNTCINQRPLVKRGGRVRSGDVLADGPSVDSGELALGQNMRIAFMPWNGYNFEDSILISERVAKDDRFTTIRIQELVCTARDTLLGPEEITADVPNVGESVLNNLDDCGIVYEGAEVRPGDILVAKITPKGESQITPEEKLLHAIFGEKAATVKDTSLRVPQGMHGTVIKVEVFVRPDLEKDQRARDIRDLEEERARQDMEQEYDIVERASQDKARRMLSGQVAVSGVAVEPGTRLSNSVLEGVGSWNWFGLRVESDDVNRQLDRLKRSLAKYRNQLQERFQARVDNLLSGNGMLPGVRRIVKVYLAVKRNIQPGDKMAGRHGNKGVVSVIMPEEDMPFDEHGRAVDIVLNPLGVPSRMNVGQILETHLGAAAVGLGDRIARMLSSGQALNSLRGLAKEVCEHAVGSTERVDALDDEAFLSLMRQWASGVPFATPAFDGINERQIKALLALAEFSQDGQITLYDGRSGAPFDRRITVGYMYMMKLNHLVDDKMHARSTGPYSLVTQQPLGGKAQFGGQRFGEMEVWALESYGAAHVLQEMLTVKSDDVVGRSKTYRNIIENDHTIDAGMPESFRVLRHEIRALGIDLDWETP